MNYFAHGRRFVADPYFLAGTAAPDWLSVVDRRVRARRKAAVLRIDDPDERLASLARGVVQHHHDDAWFHETRAFVELNFELTRDLRAHLPGDEGFRPSFVGHVLVEMLLDAALIAEDPARLDAFYAALAELDVATTVGAIEQLVGRELPPLEPLLARVRDDQFLRDYLADAPLLGRLNRVLRRLRLAELPASVADLLPSARRRVAARRDELLAGESSPLHPPCRGLIGPCTPLAGVSDP